jgi:hypothetical protein
VLLLLLLLPLLLLVVGVAVLETAGWPQAAACNVRHGTG